MIKRNVAFGLVAGTMALAFVSCSKQEKQAENNDVASGSSTAAYEVTTAGEVVIDWRYNMAAEDVENNYFSWTVGEWKVEDGFDVATGASKHASTKDFTKAVSDVDGKLGLPRTLRYLMLYPVAPRAVAEFDNFQIVENGKQLELTFIHRGNAMKIVTDENGVIDTATSFFELSGVATADENGSFVLNPEYVLAGAEATSMANADWGKIALEPSVANAEAAVNFSGTLNTVYENGVLCITGTLSAN